MKCIVKHQHFIFPGIALFFFYSAGRSSLIPFMTAVQIVYGSVALPSGALTDKAKRDPARKNRQALGS